MVVVWLLQRRDGAIFCPPVCLGLTQRWAGGRSTRLVDVVLRSYSNCFLYSEVTLVVFLSDNHRQHMQGVLSYMACLLCLAHHNRYEQNFSKSKLFPNTMCSLEWSEVIHMCDLSAETISWISELPLSFWSKDRSSKSNVWSYYDCGRLLSWKAKHLLWSDSQDQLRIV